MLQVYGIKNCDSVKKALFFFQKHAIAYEFHDFKREAVGRDTLEKWLQHTDLKTLFNTRSTSYRDLKLKEMALDDEGKIEYLCIENRLIKRPVVQYNDTIIVGFNEDNYKGVFL